MIETCCELDVHQKSSSFHLDDHQKAINLKHPKKFGITTIVSKNALA